MRALKWCRSGGKVKNNARGNNRFEADTSEQLRSMKTNVTKCKTERPEGRRRDRWYKGLTH